MRPVVYAAGSFCLWGIYMATRLPSGNYRTQVLVGYENGRRKYKSFTADTAKKANLAALQWQSEHPSAAVNDATLSSAMASFIKSRKAVLSPSTVRGYGSVQRKIEKDFSKLCKKKLDLITAAELQTMVNEMVYAGASSKTVKNRYGFLCSVWKANGLTIPDVKLPAKVKKPLNIPDEATLKKLYEASKGTDMEVPILLASIGPMRRGEIVGATIDDLDGNTIHVHRVAVLNENSEQVIKEYPKTFESTRDIVLPKDVADKIRAQGYVCNLTLNGITHRFSRLLERCGIKHFRFHDLRHAFVSICHAKGIPDAYIQARGGWATNAVMTNVYRHTLSEVQKEENKKINNIFDDLL